MPLLARQSARPKTASWRRELTLELGRHNAPAVALGSNLIQRVGSELACDTLQKILEEEWAHTRRQRVPKSALLVVLGLSMIATFIFWPVGAYLLWLARCTASPSHRWRNALVALRPFLLDPKSSLSLEFRILLWEESRLARVEPLRAELVQTITSQLQYLSAEGASCLSPRARRFLRNGLRQFQKQNAPTPFDTEFALGALLALSDTPPYPQLDLPADLVQHLRAHSLDRRIYEAMEVYLDSRAGVRR